MPGARSHAPRRGDLELDGSRSGMGNTCNEAQNYSKGPPWVFKGRALYQLHAVRAEVARKFIPPELNIVEAFGYTLGGLFLARYDSSPAGSFDEAVVITGIVWNSPTSCAWAGRVLVNSEEARVHGRREIGLPSHVAEFSLSQQVLSQSARPWVKSLWPFGKGQSDRVRTQQALQITQYDGSSLRTPLCRIARLPDAFIENQQWPGLPLQLSLPSFSGKTVEQPHLLKYSCVLNCKVKLAAPVHVSSLIDEVKTDVEDKFQESNRDVLSVLTGKPFTALMFDKMIMRVAAPVIVPPKEKESEIRSIPPASPATN